MESVTLVMESIFVRTDGYIIPENGPILRVGTDRRRRIVYIETEKMIEALNENILDSKIMKMYYRFFYSCAPLVAYVPMQFITVGSQSILFHYFNGEYHLAEIPATTPFGVIADNTGLFVITDKGSFEIKGDSAIATRKYPRSMFGTMVNEMTLYSICTTEDIILLNKGFIYNSKMYQQPDLHENWKSYAYARGHLYWIDKGLSSVKIYRVENERKTLVNTIKGEIEDVELAQGCKNFLLFVNGQAYLNGLKRIDADGLLIYFLPKSLCDMLGYR